MVEPTPEEAMGARHFAYFMVRLRVKAPGEAASLAGVVERLGTGHKRSFPDGQELLRLLADWAYPSSKMPTWPGAGNRPEAPDA